MTAIVPARWLRSPEAADYLGCTMSVIREFMRKGEIRAIKIGKRFIIDARDLDVYMERLRGHKTSHDRQNESESQTR